MIILKKNSIPDPDKIKNDLTDIKDSCSDLPEDPVYGVVNLTDKTLTFMDENHLAGNNAKSEFKLNSWKKLVKSIKNRLIYEKEKNQKIIKNNKHGN